MKRKYIIFYAFLNGIGNAEIELPLKDRPGKGIFNIRKIEKYISEQTNTENISVTNWKKVSLWN